jgi:hypothetical protein
MFGWGTRLFVYRTDNGGTEFFDDYRVSPYLLVDNWICPDLIERGVLDLVKPFCLELTNPFNFQNASQDHFFFSFP